MRGWGSYAFSGLILAAIAAVIAACIITALRAARAELGLHFKIMCWFWCALALLNFCFLICFLAGVTFGLDERLLYMQHREEAVLYMAASVMSYIMVGALFFVLFCKKRPVLCYFPLMGAAFAIWLAFEAFAPYYGYNW